MSFTVAETFDRWMNYGRSYALHPTLWDSSLALATLGPQVGGGSEAWDFSGRGNHGTPTSGLTWERGTHRGGAFQYLRFDGTDDMMSRSDAGLPTADKTICLWFRNNKNMTGGAVQYQIVANYGTDAISKAVTVLIGSNDPNLSGGLNKIGVSQYGNSVGVDYDTYDLRWHCLIGTNSGTAWTVSLDALSAAKSMTTATQSGGTFSLGKHPTAGYASQVDLSSCGVWGRILSDSEKAVLRIHPPAAYECRPLPQVFAFPSVATNRRRRVICAA